MEKVTVAWANDEQTVVLCRYLEDGWTQEDSFAALAQQRALIESSSAPVVDVLVEGTNIRWMPAGASFIKGMKTIVELRHQRQGVTIFIGAQGILASILTITMSLIDPKRREYHFVKTMDEAYELLEQIKATRQIKKIS